MNILIATGIFPPQIGGPATYSKLLKDKLPERGFAVSVVNFGDTLFLPKIIRHVVYFVKILRMGRAADIIYAQDPVSVGIPAFVAATILRKKFYLKIVGDYAWEQESVKNSASVSEQLEDFQWKRYGFKTELLKNLERFVARHAEKVIVPSEYLKRIILLWGVSQERITVIYNGFTPSHVTERKEELRRKRSLDGYTIISVGRLVPWKGFSTLIEIMPHLLIRIPDAKLLIAGEGPDRVVLEKRIKELHLEQSVILLGRLPQEELFEYIKASDVFVLNTAYEGFSHQLLEVMALGTPIITTPVGGNPEIVHDRIQGILVPWNDHMAIEEACVMLHEYASLALDLVRAAGEKVRGWSDERMIETLMQEFQNFQGSPLDSPRGTLGSSLNILSISSDRKLFETESAVAMRMRLYGGLAEKLHVIVTAKHSFGFTDTALSPEVFLHPTNALTRAGHIVRAVVIARTLARHDMKFDVVTAQDPFELGFAAFLIARILHARLHLQIHTDFMSPYFAQDSFMNRMRVYLAKFLIRRADAVRVVSARIERSLSEVDVQLPCVSVLPIFVDTERIAHAPILHDLKKKYPQFEKHILMASRLSPEKNIELAITAMRAVVKKYPKAGLIIVGSGLEETSLNELARELGLERNVVFEGWREELISYYKTADLFLLTSNYEGYGMTIVEALAAGCPVLMTDVGCAGEIVHDGENGLVVPVGDHSALVHALDQFFSGAVRLTPSLPSLLSKKEYLAQYRKSWEDALNDF